MNKRKLRDGAQAPGTGPTAASPSQGGGQDHLANRQRGGGPTEAASPERAQQRLATGTPAGHGGGGPKRGTIGPRQLNDSVSVIIRQRIADPQRASVAWPRSHRRRHIELFKAPF